MSLLGGGAGMGTPSSSRMTLMSQMMPMMNPQSNTAQFAAANMLSAVSAPPQVPAPMGGAQSMASAFAAQAASPSAAGNPFQGAMQQHWRKMLMDKLKTPFFRTDPLYTTNLRIWQFGQ